MKIIVEISKSDILNMAKNMGMSDITYLLIEQYLEIHDTIENPDMGESVNKSMKEGMSAGVIAHIMAELAKKI